MKRKRILALLLVFALAAGMGLSAMAVEENNINAEGAGGTAEDKDMGYGDQTEVIVPALLRLPTINVTIAKPATVLINPYQIKFTAADLSITGDDYLEKEDSVINIPTLITNNSEVNVKVSATGSVYSESMTEGTTETDKTLYLSNTGTFDADYGKRKKLYLELKMAAQGGNTALTVNDLKDASGKPLVMKGGTRIAQAVEIDLMDGPGATGGNAGKNKGSFMVTGKAENSTDATVTWGENDKLELNIIFDITGQLRS